MTLNSDRIWELLAKKKTQPLTKEEQAELDLLLNQAEGGFTNEIINKIWKSPLKSLPEMSVGPNTWSRIQTSINEPRPVIRLNRWIAAAAVIALIGTIVFFYLYNTRAGSTALASKEYTITTEPTSKTKVVLPDGTHVWLNGSSQLFYNTEDFGKANREVRLSGEGFFDVVKNNQHPFIIHTGSVNITVKGTAFNVKAYPGQKNIETSLIRGLIEITTNQDPERKIMVRPNEKIIIPATLSSSKPLANGKDNSLYTITRLQKDEHEVLPETVWMNKKLKFNNETFEEIAPKLESWFSVNIRFEDEAIKSKRFSGLIEKETLDQTLKAMKISYPFKYSIAGDEIMIGASGNNIQKPK